VAVLDEIAAFIFQTEGFLLFGKDADSKFLRYGDAFLPS